MDSVVINTREQPADCGISLVSGIQSALRKKHFAYIDGACYQLADDMAVAQRRLFLEWDHLEPDEYLRDGATFRRRRFGLFYLNAGTNELLPLLDSTYFQASDINRYAGGINRSFAPLRPATAENPYLRELIQFFFRQLPIEPDRLSHPWLIDVHQIRITATANEHGEPAPEGPHHDGEEFGVIQLVQRRNVVGGITTVYSGEEPLSSCTLRDPMDTLLLWDPHVMHGVSAIRPADPAEPGIRDTLLIGYDPAPLLEHP